MRLGRWRDQKRYAKQFREMGLTRDEVAAMKEMDSDTVLDRFAQIQDENRAQLKAAGVDTDSLVPQIGRHIQWIDIKQMVFRVVDFDGSGTTVDLDAGSQSIEAEKQDRGVWVLTSLSRRLSVEPVQLPGTSSREVAFYLASGVLQMRDVRAFRGAGCS